MAEPTPQEIKDLRDAPKQEKAYNDASSTPPAPMRIRKDTIKPSNESPYGGERLLRPKEQLMNEIDRMTGKAKVYDKQAADAKANRKEAEREGQKYAKGGSVGSASRRADGIAQRGKTRA